MKMSQHNIVCFGEVLWDVYPQGKKLGGAPFNVAAHSTQLGTQGHIITKVGTDAYGIEILEAMKSQDIQTDFTQSDHTFATGVVNVQLDSQGTPSYEIKKPSAWDFIHTNLENLSLVERCDALVYGSLACRTDRNRQTLKDLTDISSLNICDLNVRQNYYSKELFEELLDVSNILKINNEEAEMLCQVFGVRSGNLYEYLTETFDIDTILQTKGAQGAEAYRNGEIFRAQGIKINVIDTVGSGDAFLAGYIHSYLQSKSIQTCLSAGCKLGAFVATKSGAIPRHTFTSQLQTRYQSQPQN